MGCYGSREMKNKPPPPHSIRHVRPPRFSYCNGRITRIIQDDLVDYCENSDAEKNGNINHEEKGIEFFNETNSKRVDINGAWISGVCAGGSRNNVELFATNPQYEIQINKLNDEKKTTKMLVCVSMKQLHFTSRSSHIGFFIYRNDNPGTNLGSEHFLCVPPVYSTRGFKRIEKVSAILYLDPDIYIIIPAIFHAYHDNEFVITVIIPRDATINVRKLITPIEPAIYYR